MAESTKRETIAAIRRLRGEIDARTRSGDFQDDSDIFDLDRRLMEAELRWPGSTLRLYFTWYRPAWLVGAALVVLGVLALVPMHSVALGWTALGLGALLILGPAGAWFQSRPRVSNRRNSQ
jgi:hypothetical protein